MDTQISGASLDGTRVCKRCATRKLLHEFPLSREKPVWVCKSCTSERVRIWRNHKRMANPKQQRTDGLRQCKKCKRELPLDEFQLVNVQRGWARHECNQCVRGRIKTWWNTSPDAARSRAGKNEQLRKRVRMLRDKVYAGYGGQCNCCGENEPRFLSIDHVHNDGNIDREYCPEKQKRKRGISGASLYTRILRDNFPTTFQLLCYSCNIGKARNGGICPHQE